MVEWVDSLCYSLFVFINQHLDAFFFCNTLTTNYYERTPFHPDVLLQELIYLFHPERATEGYEATFYTPLMP